MSGWGGLPLLGIARTPRLDLTGILPEAFEGLPKEAFPVRLELIDMDTLDRVWAARATTPGPLYIPSLVELGVAPREVACRIMFASGEVLVGWFVPRRR